LTEVNDRKTEIVSLIENISLEKKKKEEEEKLTELQAQATAKIERY
jgi:hypothetical protein